VILLRHDGDEPVRGWGKSAAAQAHKPERAPQIDTRDIRRYESSRSHSMLDHER
jgi:hypothetical protein